MKFKQKVFLLVMIVVVDLILFGMAIRIWRGRTEMGIAGQSVWSEHSVSEINEEQGYNVTKYVALTFDDGPNARYTEPLLEGLRKRGIRTSFFLVGECIDGKEELVKQMAEDGHLIGVHCMTHKDLTKESPEEAKKELEETREKIRAVTGIRSEYVRPPYGRWSGSLDEIVDMIPVFWDVDSIDWRLKNTEKVTAKVVKDTKDGDIILMHDEFKTSVEAALRIIDNLTAKGYTFVTVDELMVD